MTTRLHVGQNTKQKAFNKAINPKLDKVAPLAKQNDLNDLFREKDYSHDERADLRGVANDYLRNHGGRSLNF
ncbi:MAG: hypothetical protein K9G62_07565 [Alphaproteobacteria bacterium]|nr:hypothetical protein [Alphaproteobacteria bacterium]